MSLTGNTEKLNSLITKINALPEQGEGGGGGTLETGTITGTTTLVEEPGTKYTYYFDLSTLSEKRLVVFHFSKLSSETNAAMRRSDISEEFELFNNYLATAEISINNGVLVSTSTVSTYNEITYYAL